MSTSIRLLRLLLGLCALLLVLAALYVSLGRLLLPLVAEYRDEVQAKAREALGMPVSIGRLEGGWSLFSPVLSAHDVQLGEGDSRVRLDQVRVVPDLLGSVFTRQLRLDNLQVDGLQLIVHQGEDGKWSVEGLPRQASSEPLKPQQLLNALGRLGKLSVLGGQLTFEPQGREPLTLTYVDLTLRSGVIRHRADLRLRLPDGQPLAARVRLKLDKADWKRSSGESYLSLPQSDWAGWLPPALLGDWRLDKALAGGELWLNWADGAIQRGAARVHAPELVGRHLEQEPVQVADLGLNAYLQRNGEQLELLLDDLALNLGETRWGDIRVGVRQQRDEQGQVALWQVDADRLDLTPLTPVVLALAPLPEKAHEVLSSLRPRGVLRNLRLEYRPQLFDAKRLKFFANLQQVGIDAWHAVPAVENASGSVTGDLHGGELRTASENFGLHFSTLFPQMWHYRQAGGRLLWSLNDEGFTLICPYLQTVGEEGRIASDFLIRLYKDPAREDYMDLRVGLAESDAGQAEKYLPTLSPGLSPALAEWLKTAIRGANIDEGWFQYQGSLMPKAPASDRSLGLYFRVRDAELAYQPGWPALRGARGEVLVEDDGVDIRLEEGRILDSRVHDALASVPHVEPGQVSRLAVEGDIDSSLADALKILREAPMGTQQIFAGWQGQGPLSGKLKLDIPLAKGQAPQVQVDFATEGAELSLANPALNFSQLKGAFRYNTASGLSADDIRARVLGHAVRGKALAEGARGKAVTRIEASGRAPLEELRSWLGVTQPLPLNGIIPYNLKLTLDGAASELQIDSDLNGLAVQLPAPLGKSADQPRASRLNMPLQGSERRYTVRYGELASLALVAPVGQLMQGRGELRLGAGSATLPSARGLRVRGQLAELDWDAWQAALKPYQAQTSSTQSLSALQDADVTIGQFKGFGTQVQNLAVRAARLDKSWQLRLSSDLLQGEVRLPDAQGAPIDINLVRLTLPAAKPASSTPAPDAPDPLAQVDPRRIPALDVRIAQVLQGDQPFGAWSLKARPTPQGVHFSELSLSLKGLRVGGEAGWEGMPGSSQSWYKGRIQGDNLVDVLKAWGFAPTATSERFRLDVDGRWPGSPAWLSFKRLSGSLDASLRKGQFVEVQGSASALRVFGLLNFNAIGRRLRLDFSDLLGKGLSYDTTKARLVGQSGVFTTEEPLRVVGPSSTLELNGTLDMQRDQIDATLLVTLPVTNNLPLAAIIVGAPAIGGALFIADKLLGDRVSRFASVQYKVKGDWQSPQISFDKPFEKPR